jgi:hypothetical protein
MVASRQSFSDSGEGSLDGGVDAAILLLHVEKAPGWVLMLCDGKRGRRKIRLPCMMQVIRKGVTDYVILRRVPLDPRAQG